MNYKLIFLGLISFLFFECNQKNELVIHKDLIGVHSVFEAELGEDKFFELEKKIDKNKIIVNYFDNYLTVQTWVLINACGNPLGNIKFYNDSIFLEYIETSEVLCTSLEIDKVTYFIDNPGNKKWIITN